MGMRMLGEEKFSASEVAPVKNIKKILPSIPLDSSACETTVQLGIFFDGTGNNRFKDEPECSHSNVARLYDTYVSSKSSGCFKVYIPGLGTEFPQIGEEAETTFGGAFGYGGESRIIYAMLSICNVISETLLGRIFFKSDDILALCRTTENVEKDFEVLERFGLNSRLIGGGDELRISFFKKHFIKIQEIVKIKRTPVIKECILDIFGFSRGAAEARVFCHWISQILIEQKFNEVPLRFRFLGLLDTVSSVGVMNMIGNAIFGKTGGHSDWAKSAHLHILPEIENCVHFVSMHELRKNFPLDAITVGGRLPHNCQEYAYPGTHSDVGGGYRPGQLGISVGKDKINGDTLKLSQIPLNHMFECAEAAGVPLSRASAIQVGGETNKLAVAPEVISAFKRFLAISSLKPRLLSDWMIPFLIWRWKQRDNYKSLNHVVEAKGRERQYLLDANREFIYQGIRLSWFADSDVSDAYVARSRAQPDFNANNNEYRQEDFSAFEPEAASVARRVAQESEKSFPPELADFFDKYVHDSLAGFREKFVEATGYWKYRRLFRGGDDPRVSQVDNSNSKGSVT